MPVSGVTAGDTITEAWGDSVAASVGVLEATDSTQNGRLTALEASDAAAYRPGGTDVLIADGGTGSSTAAAARTALGVGTAQTPVFAGVSVPAVVFPAVDVPSANVNTLDDYEEGTFTPTFGFATPGTSSWAYSSQAGFATKIGNRVLFHFVCTAVLTKGTGSGNLVLSGLPYAANAAAVSGARFAAELSGWTKAGYTGILGSVTLNTATATVRAYGSAQATVALTAADLTDGATVTLAGSGSYIV